MRVSILLLSVCALACVATVASAGVHTSRDISPSSSLGRLLQADHQFMQQQLAAGEHVSQKIEKRVPVKDFTNQVTYWPDVAASIMWHAVSAYCADDIALQSWSCASCSQFGPFTVTGSVANDGPNQGYVGYFTQGLSHSPIDDGGASGVSASDPFVVVAFRGTLPSSLDDWIQDLNFSSAVPFSSAYPDVEVHGGFWAAYQDLKPQITSAIDAAISASNAKTIIFAGHSLGGAMAELAALDLKINEYQSMNFASYTQGCPRVGNSAFGPLYDQMMDASFREVHNEDVVPHLPPMLLGFAHAPREVWWDEAFQNLSVCDMSGEDPTCSDSITFPSSVSDHLTYRGIDVGGYCDSAAAAAKAGAKVHEKKHHSKTAHKKQAKKTQHA